MDVEICQSWKEGWRLGGGTVTEYYNIFVHPLGWVSPLGWVLQYIFLFIIKTITFSARLFMTRWMNNRHHFVIHHMGEHSETQESSSYVTMQRWARTKFACRDWDWDFTYTSINFETETDTFHLQYNSLILRLSLIGSTAWDQDFFLEVLVSKETGDPE